MSQIEPSKDQHYYPLFRNSLCLQAPVLLRQLGNIISVHLAKPLPGLLAQVADGLTELVEVGAEGLSEGGH